MKTKFLFILLLLFTLNSYGQVTKNWKLSELPFNLENSVTTLGEPIVVSTPFGAGVHFDGKDDGYVVDFNPLNNMEEFTLEFIFRPDSDGPKAPRFLHFGELGGKRLMCEIRISEKQEWYFDAHLNMGNKKSITLIDPKFAHPTNQWYAMAVVVTKNEISYYVNGIKEMSGEADFTSFNSGKLSIGVRQNIASWFKGTICMLKMTPKALGTNELMNLNEAHL